MRRIVRIMVLGLTAITSAPAAAGCTMAKFAELPITMQNTRPIVSATINGTPARLLLDSGAFFSMLAPSAAAQYNLRLGDPPYGLEVGGVGGTIKPKLATVKQFGVAGQIIPHLEFLVGGSDPGEAGLLGQNLLSAGDAEYDLAHGVVRLWDSHGCANTNMAYWAQGMSVGAIELSATPFHTTGTVTVNGVKMSATFDTGAPTSMITRAAAARAGVRPGDAGVTRAGVDTGIGRNTVASWIGRFTSFAFGGEEIRNVRLTIDDVSSMDFDMLVGADFFLAHHIYVSKASHTLFLTYNGGPVFDLTRHHETDAKADSAPGAGSAVPGGTQPTLPGVPVRTAVAGPSSIATAAPARDEPKTAEDYARRGAASSGRRDFDAALADFSRAITLAPIVAAYRYQRALAYLGLNESVRARPDLDEALRLAPDDVDILIVHASSAAHMQQPAIARADLDHAAAVAPRGGDRRYALADAYGSIDAFDQAIEQYMLWIPLHRDDSALPEAYNGMCWARALLGRELDMALGNCDFALRLRPHTPAYLDSRGLVRLRRGDYDKAIADYTAALILRPDSAWSLYGRGLAEQHLGQAAAARIDIAAAIAQQPDIAERARKFGIVPAQ